MSNKLGDCDKNSGYYRRAVLFLIWFKPKTIAKSCSYVYDDIKQEPAHPFTGRHCNNCIKLNEAPPAIKSHNTVYTEYLKINFESMQPILFYIILVAYFTKQKCYYVTN